MTPRFTEWHHETSRGLKFTDVTDEAGVKNDKWAVAALVIRSYSASVARANSCWPLIW